MNVECSFIVPKVLSVPYIDCYRKVKCFIIVPCVSNVPCLLSVRDCFGMTKP